MKDRSSHVGVSWAISEIGIGIGEFSRQIIVLPAVSRNAKTILYDNLLFAARFITLPFFLANSLAPDSAFPPFPSLPSVSRPFYRRSFLAMSVDIQDRHSPAFEIAVSIKSVMGRRFPLFLFFLPTARRT